MEPGPDARPEAPDGGAAHRRPRKAGLHRSVARAPQHPPAFVPFRGTSGAAALQQEVDRGLHVAAVPTQRHADVDVAAVHLHFKDLAIFSSISCASASSAASSSPITTSSSSS
eukprot:CAMPEP_0113723442 /NCGR_PEP_ID=MMETSP0038_2-20120614/38425_1 /TAXON_ID=2898 /ORGANISM="Cryptomonas paramecium" /LENGTH=112 /DNA_ID=CAMNT_0000653031 /DNA_START=505 /DNA_END=841 /DNA_ORIENTATION=- /assembly_acc=CAM_ASM_000170